MMKRAFNGKPIPSLVDSMEDRAREQFGEDVNTSSKTPLGIIIRIFAWFLAGLWDIAERVYNSGFVSKSEGVQARSSWQQLRYHAGASCGVSCDSVLYWRTRHRN